MKSTTKKNADRSILTLERYLPYRLSILSNRVSGRIAETYGDKFAISVTEWRIMAVLGEYPGISADEVSNKTQIEKSILSRAISKLLNRNLRNREREILQTNGAQCSNSPRPTNPSTMRLCQLLTTWRKNC